MATDVANNPTRKQLDELDSLLQKMLAVPGNAHDETTSRKPAEKPRKAATVTPPPAPAPAAKVVTPTYTTEPAPAAVSSNSSADNWAIDLNPRNSSSVLGDRSPLVGGRAIVSEPPPRTETPGPAAILQMQTLTEAPVTVQPTRSRRRAPVPLLMRPFANVTAQFDDMAAMFGPLGRLVSGGFGRTVMGLSGLAMVAGSGVYFAMLWYGWSR